MKAIIYLAIVCFLITSCSNNDEGETSQGDLITFHFFLEILNVNGEIPGNQEVVFSNQMFLENGESYTPEPSYWRELVIDDFFSELADKILFGNANIPSGNESGISYGVSEPGLGNESWDSESYFYIQYTEGVVDTLKVHDIKQVNPSSRNFDFYLNGEPIEMNSIEGGGVAGYLTIVKDIDWSKNED